MAHVTATLDISKFEKVAEEVPQMRKYFALAVKDSLIMIEENHKLKQVRRSGSSNSRAVKGTWTRRKGTLSRSFHRDWTPGNMWGAYGSDLRRAKHVEEGGTIKAKPPLKYLAIPTEKAPKDVWPRYVPDLFFIQSLRGQPLLVRQPDPGSPRIEVLYILRKSVTLPPRPALKKAVKATEKARDDLFLDVIDKQVWGRN